MPAELLEKVPSPTDVLREVTRVKTVVAEAVEDGVKAALKPVKQGRASAEDVLEEARHKVKKSPIEAVGIVFAAGVLTGSLLTWMGCRRR